jgi:hypothetical protein
MPFQNIFELRDEPAIQMFFFGLAVLHSPDGTVWFAETHREAATHTLSIDVSMKEPPGPDMPLMRRQRHLTHDLKITMVNSAGEPVNPKAFRYVNLENDDDEKDFRSVLNFRRLHRNPVVTGQPAPSPVTVKDAKTRPGVRIDGGESVLYAARIKPGPIKLINGKPPQPDLPKLAVIVGAKLYYGPTGVKAVISGGGLSQPLSLPKPPDGSQVSYEIYINNSPLFEPDAGPHSEMREYYEVLQRTNGDDIPPDERFEIEFPAPQPPPLLGSEKFTLEGNRASFRIPCMSSTVDQ